MPKSFPQVSPHLLNIPFTLWNFPASPISRPLPPKQPRAEGWVPFAFAGHCSHPTAPCPCLRQDLTWGQRFLTRDAHACLGARRVGIHSQHREPLLQSHWGGSWPLPEGTSSLKMLVVLPPQSAPLWVIFKKFPFVMWRRAGIWM